MSERAQQPAGGRGAPSQPVADSAKPERRAYTPPTIVTLTDEQLLAELGPAQMGGYVNPFGNSI